MNTLSNGTTTIALPDDLIWTDEHGYSPVRQSVTPTIGGALWIDVSVLSAGQPITLQAGRDDEGYPYALMTRAQFAQLRVWADQPGQVFTLTYNGNSYDVIWRHEAPPALDATDLIDYPDPEPTDFVIVTLRFTRVI